MVLIDLVINKSQVESKLHNSEMEKKNLESELDKLKFEMQTFKNNNIVAKDYKKKYKNMKKEKKSLESLMEKEKKFFEDLLEKEKKTFEEFRKNSKRKKKELKEDISNLKKDLDESKQRILWYLHQNNNVSLPPSVLHPPPSNFDNFLPLNFNSPPQYRQRDSLVQPPLPPPTSGNIRDNFSQEFSSDFSSSDPQIVSPVEKVKNTVTSQKTKRKRKSSFLGATGDKENNLKFKTEPSSKEKTVIKKEDIEKNLEEIKELKKNYIDLMDD